MRMNVVLRLAALRLLRCELQHAELRLTSKLQLQLDFSSD